MQIINYLDIARNLFFHKQWNLHANNIIMATSFHKKSKTKVFQISGTKASLQNNQLLISTGVPSLDAVLGGGVAVGTVILIEEDTYGSYSKLVLKYYLSEGVMNGHHLLLASADTKPEALLGELPAALVDDPGGGDEMMAPKTGTSGPGSIANPQGSGLDKTSVESENMKIAWRYQHLPQVQSNPGNVSGSRFGHYYDLTKTMDPLLLERTTKTLVDIGEVELSTCNHCSEKSIMNPTYAKLLQEIKKVIDTGQFSTAAQNTDRNILRIGIHSLASPQWGEEGGIGHSLHSKESGAEGFDPSLCRFLYALRSMLRTSFATCVITMPTHLFQETAFTKRIEHLCDTVIRLEAFAGSDKEQNPVYKEYHGLFHIIKLPRLNSLTCHMPDTLDLAFKLRRKKFMIEKLHLPPELSDTASRDQEDPLKPINQGPSCGSSLGTSKLDF